MSTSTCYNNISSNTLSAKYNQPKTIRSRIAESLQSNEQQKPLKSILRPSTVTKMRYLNTFTSTSLPLMTTSSKTKHTSDKDTSRHAPKVDNIVTKQSKVLRPKPTISTEPQKTTLTKQSSSPSLGSPKVTSKNTSKSTPTKTVSLQSLKAKFTAKSATYDSSTTLKTNHSTDEKKKDEFPLPWQDYTSKKKEEQPVCVTETKDYDKMIQELSVSHAMVAASSFETMCFVEADQLNKNLEDTQKLMGSLYERIRNQSDVQRSTATSLKLNYVSLPMVSNFIEEVCKTSEATALLVDELYFASQHAHRTETRYLRHIAGTLATMLSSQQLNQKEHINDFTEREEDNAFLIAILNKLGSLLLDVDDDQQQMASKSSSIASTCSSSSTSTASTVYSGHTSVDSFDTAEIMSTGAVASSTTQIQRRINKMIDKLSIQLQQKHHQIRLFEIQAATQEELARQRERSASLVLALEQNRSQRLTLAKQQEKEISALKDQLLQETSKRQALQDRVAALQNENIELKKGLQKELIASKDACHLQIEQLHEQWDKGKELQKALEDKTKIEQSILKTCHQVITNETKHEVVDTGKAVVKVIQQLKHTENALAHQEPDGKAVLKQQQNLILDSTASPDYKQLQLAFEQAQQAYTARESAYILQTASVEAELERILKEYDRLTRNIVDFNLERKRFEDEIRALQQEKQKLIQKVCDQHVCNLSEERGLRKEFRELMASVKESHAQALMAELDRRLQLEQELRDVKSDNEMKRWQKVDVAVQTNFAPLLTFATLKNQ